MKIGILGGGNCHALTFARHFAEVGIDCFGIGRATAKAAPLWLAPAGYRYYVAHLGGQLKKALEILDAEQPEVVICIAAQGESAASFGEHGPMFYQTNCVILVRLVEELRKRPWLKRFVHISTSELYGSVTAPASEYTLLNPTSPYAISKAAFDAHLKVMHRVHGFPVIVVRPSNAYCQGQQLHRIVPRAVIAAVYGKRIQLQGGGAACKAYLHTTNLAEALEIIIAKAIRDLVSMVAERSGRPFESFVDLAPARLGEDSKYWINSSRIKSLGWKQKISLEHGIDRMIAWAKAFPELATMPDECRILP
jgi:dTDP-glucose 4,6-dehydratase